MFDLNRFKQAQASPTAGFDAALAEIRAGRKRGHWIWFVFPQLAGLGSSPQSQLFGLYGVADATAYLHDPVLRGRLLTISTAVAEHLAEPTPSKLTYLMASSIDAQKLVSSMTLFGHVARRAFEADGLEECRELAAVADRILAVAAAQGLPACGYTLRQLGE